MIMNFVQIKNLKLTYAKIILNVKVCEWTGWMFSLPLKIVSWSVAHVLGSWLQLLTPVSCKHTPFEWAGINWGSLVPAYSLQSKCTLKTGGSPVFLYSLLLPVGCRGGNLRKMMKHLDSSPEVVSTDAFFLVNSDFSSVLEVDTTVFPPNSIQSCMWFLVHCASGNRYF